MTAVNRVDILINNAGAGAEGFTTRRPFAETDPMLWESYLRVNLSNRLFPQVITPPRVLSRCPGRAVLESGQREDFGDTKSRFLIHVK